eukprot:scaffold22.g6086.t1
MRHRLQGAQPSTRHSYPQAKVVVAALWAAVPLLLLAFLAYPRQPSVVQETLTIKATLSQTTLDGQRELSAAQRSSSGGGGGGNSSDADTSAIGTAAAAGELSTTSAEDWHPPRKLRQGSEAEAAGGAGAGGADTAAAASSAASADAAAGAAQRAEPAAAGDDVEEEEGEGVEGAGAPQFTSRAKIYAVPASNGQPIKYYYKFQNVKLTRQALYFYHGRGFKPPNDVWVDFVSGNLTRPSLPNTIVIKGEVKRQLWYHLPVKYLNARRNEAQCNGWIDKPVYLLQARYSYNIWHTWNEGLMGVFQTLREQGYLPLVQVDSEGNMREVTEGMGPTCPLVWDAAANGTVPDPDCAPRSGVVAEATCDIKNQAWCREGVVSYAQFNGPMVLPYSASSVMNKWSQIYVAMTDDVRDWSRVDGWCFRNLIVGKTSTLNFYQPVNASAGVDAHRRERVEAMSVFKRFVTTAQRDWVRGQRLGNPLAHRRYRGYKDKRMEALRRGVGPERLAAVGAVQPEELPFPLLQQERDEIYGGGAGAAAVSARRHRRRLLEQPEAGAGASLSAGAAEGEVHEAGAHAAEAAAGEHGEHPGLDDDGDDPGPERPQEHLQQEEAGEEQQQQQQQGGGGSDADADAATRAQAAEAQLLGAAGAAAAPEEDEGEEQAAPASEEEEAAALLAAREAALGRMPALLPPGAGFRLEEPRPVVTYMSRNFFSRGVLNEQDILEYILTRYNVTLRVTTFEEPLLEVMELFARTDVLIGMMFPYGWRLPDGSTIRGHNYREIVLASETPYLEWVNPHWEHAFFRRQDFQRRWNATYRLHPDPEGPHPKDGWPGNYWIYQNTYVDMASFGPVVFPRGGPRIGLQPPFPLAVLSPGFLIEATQLSSYADRLASWGYTCVLWDATQQALDPNTGAADVLSAAFIREVISWAEEDSVMRRLADTQRTFLVGHSRGGKISVLAAATDPRVKALLLLDPVDVTKWAPETPDFPSAVAALRKAGRVDTRARPLPLAVVASQLGPLDCAPPPPVSFFDAAASPAWEVVVQGAGHLQFLDHRGGLMDSLCAAGEANDAAVREVAQAAMVVWAEMFVRPAPRGPRQASAAGGDGGGGSVAASSMSLRVGLDADGNLVAGVGSFDAMRRLFATEEAARTLLVRSGKGGGGGLQLSTRLKNFSLLEAREGEAGA